MCGLFRKLVAVALFLLIMLGHAGATDAFGENADSQRALSYEEIESVVQSARGRIVLINYFASWCPPCRMEIQDLIRIRREYSPEDLMIIGISLDEDANAMRSFVQKSAITYPVWLAESSVARKTGFVTIPYNRIYDASGTAVHAASGVLDADGLRDFLDESIRRNQRDVQ
ncbi:MAG: redoxin domain-containing protein [Desulfovibrionaceae bacterium]|nr:redoxin domain-containing protein [Desulfovibrionaceae bacterium]